MSVTPISQSDSCLDTALFSHASRTSRFTSQFRNDLFKSNITSSGQNYFYSLSKMRWKLKSHFKSKYNSYGESDDSSSEGDCFYKSSKTSVQPIHVFKSHYNNFQKTSSLSWQNRVDRPSKTLMRSVPFFIPRESNCSPKGQNEFYQSTNRFNRIRRERKLRVGKIFRSETYDEAFDKSESQKKRSVPIRKCNEGSSTWFNCRRRERQMNRLQTKLKLKARPTFKTALDYKSEDPAFYSECSNYELLESSTPAYMKRKSRIRTKPRSHIHYNNKDLEHCRIVSLTIGEYETKFHLHTENGYIADDESESS